LGHPIHRDRTMIHLIEYFAESLNVTQNHFRTTSSDLAKHSITRNIARFLCDSQASCLNPQQLLLNADKLVAAAPMRMTTRWCSNTLSCHSCGLYAFRSEDTEPLEIQRRKYDIMSNKKCSFFKNITVGVMIF